MPTSMISSMHSFQTCKINSYREQAHAKSGTYAKEKMAKLYDEMGLSAGLAGMGG